MQSDGQSSGDTGGFLIGASAPVMTPRSEIVASVGVVPYSLFDAGLFRVYKMGPVKPVSLEKHKAQQKSKKAITPSATSSQLQGGYLVQPLLPCLCEDPTRRCK